MREDIKKCVLAYVGSGLKAEVICGKKYSDEPSTMHIETMYHANIDILWAKRRYRLISARPILRKLSDLADFYDEICWNVFKAGNTTNYNFAKFGVDEVIRKGVDFDNPYGFVEWMIENKFDIHNLIPTGDAVAVTKEFNPYEEEDKK